MVPSNALAALCAGCLLLAAPAMAQTDAENRPFFDPNYAADPLGPQRQDPVLPRVESPTPVSTLNPQKLPPGDSAGVAPTPSTEPSPAATPVVISRIGLIVGSKEKGHYEKLFKTLLDIISTTPLQLGTVYFISPPDRALADSPSFIALTKRQLTYETLDVPPAQYKVTKSPTWVLETAAGASLTHGEILIEGVMDIQSAINKQGQFNPGEILATREPS